MGMREGEKEGRAGRRDGDEESSVAGERCRRAAGGGEVAPSLEVCGLR